MNNRVITPPKIFKIKDDPGQGCQYSENTSWHPVYHRLPIGCKLHGQLS